MSDTNCPTWNEATVKYPDLAEHTYNHWVQRNCPILERTIETWQDLARAVAADGHYMTHYQSGNRVMVSIDTLAKNLRKRVDRWRMAKSCPLLGERELYVERKWFLDRTRWAYFIDQAELKAVQAADKAARRELARPREVVAFTDGSGVWFWHEIFQHGRIVDGVTYGGYQRSVTTLNNWIRDKKVRTRYIPVEREQFSRSRRFISKADCDAALAATTAQARRTKAELLKLNATAKARARDKLKARGTLVAEAAYASGRSKSSVRYLVRQKIAKGKKVDAIRSHGRSAKMYIVEPNSIPPRRSTLQKRIFMIDGKEWVPNFLALRLGDASFVEPLIKPTDLFHWRPITTGGNGSLCPQLGRTINCRSHKESDWELLVYSLDDLQTIREKTPGLTKKTPAAITDRPPKKGRGRPTKQILNPTGAATIRTLVAEFRNRGRGLTRKEWCTARDTRLRLKRGTSATKLKTAERYCQRHPA